MPAQIKHIIVLLTLSLIGCHQTESNEIKELEIFSVDAPLASLVAQPIKISINTNSISPLLHLSHSLGASIVLPTQIDQTEIHYQIPSHLTQVSGIINWKILNSKEKKTGKITINAEYEIDNIEVYIGPTNLMAGRPNSAMTTGLFFDQYDNLVSNYPTSLYTTDPIGGISRDLKKTNNGLIYQMHNAPNVKGNLTVSAYTPSATTQEYSYRVNANNPTNFNIKAYRQHRFADATSLCRFETERLIDRYGNTVEDGTIVHFTLITNQVTSQCQGVTIDGKATCQFLHPDHPCTWEVYSQSNTASSNKINLAFDAAIREIPAQINSNNLLVVGPIKSYIGQLISDGYPITLEVVQQSQIMQTQRIYTLDGQASFDLNSLQLDRSYQQTSIKIVAGGLENILNIKLNSSE